MARSEADKQYGDAIRQGRPVPCPKCGATSWWVGVPEFTAHVWACTKIELGLIVGEMQPPDDLLPEVAKKPKGWGWT